MGGDDIDASIVWVISEVSRCRLKDVIPHVSNNSI
jgi:hypothetical protein